MIASRPAIMSALVTVAIALAPVRVLAAVPPRVVALAELAARPIEVAISSRHLTLIHFETGDVSMVAVGDPAIVSVTVKGPDVLLKALSSSGSTNAFIWQASRYTQWTLAIRQSSKDARLIIVKDSITTPRDESTGKGAEYAENDGKTATDPAITAATSGQPSAGTTAASLAIASGPAPKASIAPASEQPTDARTTTTAACGKLVVLDQFVKTLNVHQRELFGTFLTEPTLERLRTLLRALTSQQRCDLLALLPVPASSGQTPTDSSGLIGTTSRPAAADAQNRDQAEKQATESRQETEAQGAPASEAVQADTLMPAGVTLTVTPQVIDGQLFIYYTLENQGEATLLTDILRLRIFDRNGNRLAFKINRASPNRYIGRLEANSVEYGLIGLDTAEKELVLEWKLIILGSGAQRLLREEVQLQPQGIDLEAP